MPKEEVLRPQSSLTELGMSEIVMLCPSAAAVQSVDPDLSSPDHLASKPASCSVAISQRI